MKPFKPMLAGVLTASSFPYLVSPKLDGIRCIIKDNKVLSRTLKPIPNLYIQPVLSALDLDGLDGELIVGEPTDPAAFKNSTSFVMSRDKVGNDWAFWVFDDFTNPTVCFTDRFGMAHDRVIALGNPHVKIVPHTYISNQTQLDKIELLYLELGFEGVMLRDPMGTYKYGRSTSRENTLLKLKRFKDDEAVIIGFDELMTNENSKTTNELGDSVRSSHQKNMLPANTLGSLTVRGEAGIIFSIGSGFTMEEREDIWSNREYYLGRQVKYKYFEIGEYEKPRFPIFLGHRDNIDIGG